MRERGAGGRRLRRRDRPWSQRAACTTTLVVVERARVAATRPQELVRPPSRTTCVSRGRRAPPRATAPRRALRRLALGPARGIDDASGDLLRVRRGAGPPDRDPMAMPFAKVQRQTVYASLLSSFSHTHKSCSGCSLSRGSTALGGLARSRTSCGLSSRAAAAVCMCAIICSGWTLTCRFARFVAPCSWSPRPSRERI